MARQNALNDINLA